MKRRKPAYRARLDQDKAWERLNVLNMSQNELARRIGRSQGFVSELFNGRRYAAGETRRRMVAALGVARFEDLFILEEYGE
ncbi:MAG: helix-turn-helix transcriptional regulator [Chloroflexi bacterium]|nr:helix-turn-helix transcriptional regulator [Chloroflexota bacterium]